MTKYKINWLVVLRNLAFVSLLIICNIANAQIKEKDKQLDAMRKEVNLTLMGIQHYNKSKLNHKVYNYIPNNEKMENNQTSQQMNTRIYLGKYKITHYCACTRCCGPNAQGITASGKKVQEGVTIAVDKHNIKLGSKVYIDGYGEREAQDTGSAIKGNRIDVYVADHQKALDLGVVYKDVWLIKEV